MPTNNSILKLTIPLFITFILISCLLYATQKQFMIYNIDTKVVFAANSILFVVSILCIALHAIAKQNKNPNVAIRTSMMTTLLKLVFLGAAAVIYIVVTGANRNAKALFCAMFLYIIYTITEVRISLKLNNKNGSN